MATSSVLSKCKRKGLFQTNFPKGLSGSCTVRTVMKNFLYPVLCLSRQFAIKVSFPWTQNNTDFYPKDPLLCRLCGSVLLYRRLKLVPDGQLDPKEFLKAVKDCVFIVSGLLSQLDPDRTLSDLFGPRLDKIFKDAFTTMSDNNLNLHLEVSNVSNLHITGVRSILGPLEPSKNCYVQEILGQKVYLEPADMEKLHKKGAIFLPQDIVEHLVQKFQIDVKFITKEKFYVTRSDGGLVQGSVSTVRSHHMWTFESPLNREKLLSGQYPLSWRVADMDLWVHYRLPHYRKLSAFFKNSQRP